MPIGLLIAVSVAAIWLLSWRVNHLLEKGSSIAMLLKRGHSVSQTASILKVSVEDVGYYYLNRSELFKNMANSRATRRGLPG